MMLKKTMSKKDHIQIFLCSENFTMASPFLHEVDIIKA
jgi:hypothetical protein